MSKGATADTDEPLKLKTIAFVHTKLSQDRRPNTWRSLPNVVMYAQGLGFGHTHLWSGGAHLLLGIFI